MGTGFLNTQVCGSSFKPPQVLSLWEGLHSDGISCADQGDVHSQPSALGPESKMGKSLFIDMLTEIQC